MRAREIESFKKLLKKKKSEIERELKYFEENRLKVNPKDSTGDISGYATHPADQVLSELDHEQAYLLASRLRDIRFAIDEALERIENNEYGICIACSRPIKKERLRAIPWTELCIQCQQKLESEESGE